MLYQQVGLSSCLECGLSDYVVVRVKKALLKSVIAIACVWIFSLLQQVLQCQDCFGYSIDLHEAFVILLLWTYCSHVAGVWFPGFWL